MIVIDWQQKNEGDILNARYMQEVIDVANCAESRRIIIYKEDI